VEEGQEWLLAILVYAVALMEQITRHGFDSQFVRAVLGTPAILQP
jgi:hypothetical protein